MKKISNKIFFLYKEPDLHWPLWKQMLYYVYREVILICSGAGMGVSLLLLALGPYAVGEFTRFALPEYFTQYKLLMLNAIPVVLLILLCYAVTGRAWSAFLLGSVIPVCLSLGNYYKIWFRDDPLYFEDIMLYREAINMVGREKYSLFIDRWILIVIGYLIIISLILYLGVPGKVKK